jgi:8-oxo-dGTP pyrophosphatase MutT (NUDIX family)
MKTDWVWDLSERLTNGSLPGLDAHKKMAHPQRFIELPPENAKLAGVMALFYPKGNQWQMVLIERQSFDVRDQHKGQISFPGGKFDITDADLSITATRETEEEIGVFAQHIKLLGALTPLYISVSNFHVFPFIGVLDFAPVFKPQITEVKEIIEIPMLDLLNPQNQKLSAIQLHKDFVLSDVPSFNFKEKIIWGATAMIISEIADLISPYKLIL